MSFFTVHHRSKKSKARLGTITTAHGTIQTPAFVPVATKATLKGLTPQQIKDLNIQIAFVNTYHLVTHPGTTILEQAGGAHKFGKLDIPLMSDSGGFQVFSLAVNNKKMAHIRGEEDPYVQKITEDGVIFRSTFDGSLIEFTPEKSMHFQQQIGADIIMAFDECTYYPATHEYAVKAMDRTHDWLKRCIDYMAKNKSIHGHPQYLYGIIQGAKYEDLRKKSAEFITSLGTPGVAIGGVSVGETKAEMREQVGWAAEFLPADRHVHLLGVGQLDDLYDLVVHGIDTFDCVEATRIARTGELYQWDAIVKRFNLPKEIVDKVQSSTIPAAETKTQLDILKSKYRDNLTPIDENCTCWACANFTKSYLHHLFKQKEMLGYTLATYHNLHTLEQFMKVLREMIAADLI